MMIATPVTDALTLAGVIASYGSLRGELSPRPAGIRWRHWVRRIGLVLAALLVVIADVAIVYAIVTHYPVMAAVGAATLIVGGLIFVR